MKYVKKILVMLTALCLSAAFAACGSSAGTAGGESAPAESAAESSTDENTSEAVSETNGNDAKDKTAEAAEDIVKTVNVGIIVWSFDKADKQEFVEAVQSALTEQYPEETGEVFVMDARAETAMLPEILSNMIAMWEGENTVILIVNDEDGCSDEDLLNVLNDAEKAGLTAGVDHVISGAPAGTFVYDASDAAGCASLIMENAFK